VLFYGKDPMKKFHLLFFIPILCFVNIQAQDRSGNATPPKLLSRPSFEYSKNMLDHGIEGDITIRIAVSSKGIVDSLQIIKALPYMDTAKVITEVEKWKFKPAEIDGKPVACTVIQKAVFYKQNSVNLKKVFFTVLGLLGTSLIIIALVVLPNRD
jgi:hypothetical protein